jgi:hypothetical protein
MTISADSSVYVTNSRAPQILRLKADRKELEVWLEDKQFDPPKDGVGLDGIAIGGDGNIYLNTFTRGEFFRVEMREGRSGKVTRLATSRPLTLPDGLRPLSDRNLSDPFFLAPRRNRSTGTIFWALPSSVSRPKTQRRRSPAFTAASIAGVLPLLPSRPSFAIVCGGGTRNKTLLRELAGRLPCPVGFGGNLRLRDLDSNHD